jgi:hypothetical protein
LYCTFRLRPRRCYMGLSAPDEENPLCASPSYVSCESGRHTFSTHPCRTRCSLAPPRPGIGRLSGPCIGGAEPGFPLPICSRHSGRVSSGSPSPLGFEAIFGRGSYCSVRGSRTLPKSSCVKHHIIHCTSKVRMAYSRKEACFRVRWLSLIEPSPGRVA